MAAVTQSQGNSDASGTATSIAAEFDDPVTNGSDLVAFISFYSGGGQATSIVDDGSNSWARIDRVVSDLDASFTMESWRALNVTGGASFTITASFDAGGYASITIHEVESAADIPDHNVFEGGAVDGVTVDLIGLTATVNGLHLAACGYAGAGSSWSVGTGWTEVWEQDEANTAGAILVESRAAVASVSQVPAWNTNFENGDTGAVIGLHVVIENAAAPAGNPWPYYHQHRMARSRVRRWWERPGGWIWTPAYGRVA